MEKFAVEKNNITSICRTILLQKLTIFHLDLQKKSVENSQSINFSQNSKKSCFERILAMSNTFQYDRTFPDNILVVEQMGFGKTSFVQNLGKNRIFCDGLLSVDWGLGIKNNLTKSRENEIRQYFDYTHVEFHYPDDIAKFELLIEIFQKDTLDTDDDNNSNKETNNGKCKLHIWRE